jgi:hypothetical protein
MFNWLFGLTCPDCGRPFWENEQYCPHYLDASTETFSRNIAQQYLLKAQTAYERGRSLRAALSNFHLALQYDPALAAAYNLRGLILDAMGQFDEAIRSDRQTLQLDPEFEEASANLEDAEGERQGLPPGERRIHPSDPKWLKVIFGGLLIITCLAAAFGGIYVLYRVGGDYLGPKTTLTFEPDDSQISTVDPKDLETTAHLLTERAHFLGYPRVSFVVSPSGKIIGKVPGNGQAEALAKRITAIGLLEFVDFGKTHIAEGTTVGTDLDHRYLRQGKGTTWHTIMTGEEIATVNVGVDVAGKPAIDFVLTPKGSEIFYQYTSENIGSYLGIVLDKVVISTPWVQGAIPDGQGQISGNFTEEAAQELAMFLKMTPLPIPIRLVEGPESTP